MRSSPRVIGIVPPNEPMEPRSSSSGATVGMRVGAGGALFADSVGAADGAGAAGGGAVEGAAQGAGVDAGALCAGGGADFSRDASATFPRFSVGGPGSSGSVLAGG